MKKRILIADDSDVSREYLANILKAAGYDVIQAIDGGSAFKVVMEHDVALAIIDHYMSPHGGLEFARGIQAGQSGLPMIMVTNEDTTDLLLETTRSGIGGYLKKPADPKRLLEMVRRALREPAAPLSGSAETGLVSETVKTLLSADELMDRAILLARRNVEQKTGGPFGAVVADADGRILGEGASGHLGRADPIAHAEVMAIRAATEKLNRAELTGCILYATSEPTRIGRALIDSVGIGRVFFALSHADISGSLASKTYADVEYIQTGREAALFLIDGGRG